MHRGIGIGLRGVRRRRENERAVRDAERADEIAMRERCEERQRSCPGLRSVTGPQMRVIIVFASTEDERAIENAGRGE